MTDKLRTVRPGKSMQHARPLPCSNDMKEDRAHHFLLPLFFIYSIHQQENSMAAAMQRGTSHVGELRCAHCEAYARSDEEFWGPCIGSTIMNSTDGVSARMLVQREQVARDLV